MSPLSARSTFNPHVSAVVLTRERPALLRRTLQSLQQQDVASLETIVVDNGSRDDTVEMLKREFPNVVLIALKENTGIHGRNVGLAKAKGQVILSLDDDIELVDPGALTRISALFDSTPRLGALTLKICEGDDPTDYVESHWWHPLPKDRFQNQSFSTDRINEAAVAFRRSAIAQTGGYYERLFWGGEEWDLVCGILNAGFEIRYFPEPVMHLAPRGHLHARADPRHILTVRNRCWIAFRRLPISSALSFSVPRLALWAVRAIRHGYVGYYLYGLWGLACAVPHIIRERRPLSPAAYTYLRKLRSRNRALLMVPPNASHGGRRDSDKQSYLR